MLDKAKENLNPSIDKKLHILSKLKLKGCKKIDEDGFCDLFCSY